MKPYPIPAGEARAVISVLSSRFIASLSPAFSVEEARAFVRRIKEEFPDATHNVPAFIIGHGDSQISHCSDDGEPSGTAGRPALSVLGGSGLGDLVVVVTRYFGGTKLGTGGLVRAYGDAVRAVLALTRSARKIQTSTIIINTPYVWYERLRRLLTANNAQILDQVFAEDVALTAKLPCESMPALEAALSELTSGKISPQLLSINDDIVPDPN